MVFLLICAILVLLGMIHMQARWYRQGKLTEINFVPFQAFIWSFLILAICLPFSSTLTGKYIGGALFFLIFFRWVPGRSMVL